MFKRLQKWYEEFVRRHIACWPEAIYPHVPQKPAADASVISASVSRFFKYNQPGDVYILLYEPLYDNAITCLRKEGWEVTLYVGSSGDLFYTVTIKKAMV